jgi:hypothetical protein
MVLSAVAVSVVVLVAASVAGSEILSVCAC